MNNFLSRLYNSIPRFLRNRYILTIIIFFIWILLFDNNNLIDRVHDMSTLRQLEHDREYYTRRINEDRRKLEELRTDNKNLEKFAREQYFMKRDNEDLFIIITDKKNRNEEKVEKKWFPEKKRDSKAK